jgi:hypothetical protein
VDETNEVIIPVREDGRLDMQRVVALYDAPAYIRRARIVEGTLQQVLQHCRQQRELWLAMARLRLGQLGDLAGSWQRLRPWLADDDQVAILARLETELAPQLRCPVEQTSSDRVLQRALQKLCASLERFNERWHVFLSKVDLTALNALRADYNRWYVLEKECAVRSARLAREGFVPLSPLTATDLEERLPVLPVPVLVG